MSASDFDMDRLSDDQDDFDDDEDTLDGRFLIFSLGERNYGIEIKYITEIVGLQTITEIPDMPSYIKGVINLRGKVVALIDVRNRFKMTEIGYTEKTCVVILNIHGQLVGLIVDTVREVIKINPNQMEEAPRFSETEGSRFIKALAKVKNDVKILLNTDRIIKEEDANALETVLSN